MATVGMRVTRSRRKFMHSRKVKLGMAAVLDDEAKPLFIDAFKRVVANWDHKVEFKARKFMRPNKFWINVFPAGKNKKIWIFVSGGTKGPYPIPKTPKTAGTLAFLWGGKGSYKPKTAPVGKFGGPGTVAGGVMHFPKQVMHPGIKAREFEKTIKEDNEAKFSRIMENGWRRVIRSL